MFSNAKMAAALRPIPSAAETWRAVSGPLRQFEVSSGRRELFLVREFAHAPTCCNRHTSSPPRDFEGFAAPIAVPDRTAAYFRDGAVRSASVRGEPAIDAGQVLRRERQRRDPGARRSDPSCAWIARSLGRAQKSVGVQVIHLGAVIVVSMEQV